MQEAWAPSQHCANQACHPSDTLEVGVRGSEGQGHLPLPNESEAAARTVEDFIFKKKKAFLAIYNVHCNYSPGQFNVHADDL